MIRERPDGIVCDLDGVVYRGDAPIPGSAEAISTIRGAGARILFSTNNSRSTIGQYIDKLSSMGVQADASEIVTSAVVTAEELQRRDFAGRTAIVVGGDGIHEALGDVCISVKTEPSVTKADLCVVGWDPTFDYAAMARAAAAVRDGAVFIATNLDSSFPAEEGLLPGTGALVAAISTASGAKAEAMGKPFKPMLDAVARRMQGCERIVSIGDRADTDLAGAADRGWGRVLVLSGVTSADQARRLDPPPDLVVADLRAFAAATFR